MKEIKFDTSKWTRRNETKVWPAHLVSLVGEIFEKSVRPLNAVVADGRVQPSSINFERILIDQKEFQNRALSRLLKSYDDPIAKRLYLSLTTFAYLGNDVSTLIENGRQYSAKKVKHMAVGSYGSPEDFNQIGMTALPEGLLAKPAAELWQNALPSFIGLAFFPGVSLVSPKSEDDLEVEMQVMSLLEPYVERSGNPELNYEAGYAAFNRQIYPYCSKNSLAKFAMEGWYHLHAQLSQSVLFLLGETIFKGLEGHLIDPAASRRYLRFWYTSQGPWAGSLRGFTPALSEAMQSLYTDLPFEMKEAFDRNVFLEDTTPPHPVVKHLAEAALTHAQTVGAIRDAERAAKASLEVAERRKDKNLVVDSLNEFTADYDLLKDRRIQEFTSKELGIDGGGLVGMKIDKIR